MEADRQDLSEIADMTPAPSHPGLAALTVMLARASEFADWRQRDEAAMDPVEPLRILASAPAFTIKSADLHSRPTGSGKDEPIKN